MSSPPARPPAGDPVARATRRFAAPPERVFDAWLDPALVGRWMFAAGGDEIVQMRIDPRVGGAFSFRVRRGGEEIDHVGVYREIDRPRRLVFTWGIAGHEGSDGVEIDIVPTADGCELTLAHRMHPDWTEFAPRAARAWSRMLAALGAELAAPIEGGDAPPVPALSFVRRIAAPAADVFAAWTDPATFARWMSPAPYHVHECVLDPRPGGRYRFAGSGPDCGVHVTSGEYLEVVPGRRLVMTWRYEGPHGDDPYPSLLTVELAEPSPGVTELTLTHARARDEHGRALLAGGWARCLDWLATIMALPRRYAMTVTRRVAASPADVFAAWTDPERMRRWWTEMAVVDARPGGRFRAESRGADGATHVIVGEYLEYVPDERLAMSWIYDAPGAGAGVAEWRVRVELQPAGGGHTDVTVTETEAAVADAWAADPAESRAAWAGALDLLAAHLGGAAAPSSSPAA